MRPRVDGQIRALSVAKTCAAYGARVRTITALTGLPPREVLRQLFPDRTAVPRGRSPDSPEWYFHANLLHRAEASIFMALFGRLRGGGFGAVDALLAAYKHYLCTCHPPARISFDRAFDLVAHTEGIWLTRTRSFGVLPCPGCRSEFLAAYGTVALSNQHCPFCKLVRRYWNDPRVQEAFPLQPLHAPSAEQLQVLTWLREQMGPTEA